MNSNKKATAICPVMNVPTDKKKAEEKGLVREYKGTKYYLCCQPCGEAFDADPEKYAGGTDNTTGHSHDHGHHHHA